MQIPSIYPPVRTNRFESASNPKAIRFGHTPTAEETILRYLSELSPEKIILNGYQQHDKKVTIPFSITGVRVPSHFLEIDQAKDAFGDHPFDRVEIRTNPIMPSRFLPNSDDQNAPQLAHYHTLMLTLYHQPFISLKPVKGARTAQQAIQETRDTQVASAIEQFAKTIHQRALTEQLFVVEPFLKSFITNPPHIGVPTTSVKEVAGRSKETIHTLFLTVPPNTKNTHVVDVHYAKETNSPIAFMRVMPVDKQGLPTREGPYFEYACEENKHPQVTYKASETAQPIISSDPAITKPATTLVSLIDAAIQQHQATASTAKPVTPNTHDNAQIGPAFEFLNTPKIEIDNAALLGEDMTSEIRIRGVKYQFQGQLPNYDVFELRCLAEDSATHGYPSISKRFDRGTREPYVSIETGTERTRLSTTNSFTMTMATELIRKIGMMAIQKLPQ